MESNQVKIDLVTKRPDGGCTLVLVETGPWIGEQKNQNMQRLGTESPVASVRSSTVTLLGGIRPRWVFR